MLGTGPLAAHPAIEWADNTPDYEVLALTDAVTGAQQGGPQWNSRGRGRGFGRGGWHGGSNGGGRGRFRQEDRYKSSWKGAFTTKHFAAPADPLNRVNYDKFFVVSALISFSLYIVGRFGYLLVFVFRTTWRNYLTWRELSLRCHAIKGVTPFR